MSMINEFVEKLRCRLKKELQLADEDKRKADVLQFDRAVGYANGMAIAIDILNQLEEEYKDVPDINVGKWILCSEKLPDYGIEVLAYDGSNDDVWVVSREINGSGEDVWENKYSDYEDIDAYDYWMPLPEPYKGE